MIYIFILLLFTLPAWSIELEEPEDAATILSSEALEARDKLETETKALSEDNPEIITINEPDHMGKLPPELILYVMSFCEQKNVEKNKWSNVISYTFVSKYFKNAIRQLIPALTPLGDNPSSITMVTLLSKIEECDKNHSKLHQVINIPYFLDSFPRYLQEVIKLIDSEPRADFSFYFWRQNGAERIKAIREQHKISIEAIRKRYKISPVERSLWNLPKRLCSSYAGDPFAWILTCTGLASFTTIGGVYINMSILSHHEAEQLAQANYIQEYQKNLAHIQSNNYEIVNNGDYDFQFVPESCFKGNLWDHHKHFCINRHEICQPQQQSEIYLNQSIFPRLNQLFDGLFSPQFIKSFLMESLGTMCQNGDFYHIGRVKNSYFFKHHETYPSKFLGMEGSQSNLRCSYRSNGDTASLMVQDFYYDPHCIAKHVTPNPQVPSNIPTIAGWTSGIIGGYALTFIIFAIGWYWGI